MRRYSLLWFIALFLNPRLRQALTHLSDLWFEQNSNEEGKTIRKDFFIPRWQRRPTFPTRPIPGHGRIRKVSNEREAGLPGRIRKNEEGEVVPPRYIHRALLSAGSHDPGINRTSVHRSFPSPVSFRSISTSPLEQSCPRSLSNPSCSGHRSDWVE